MYKRQILQHGYFVLSEHVEGDWQGATSNRMSSYGPTGGVVRAPEMKALLEAKDQLTPAEWSAMSEWTRQWLFGDTRSRATVEPVVRVLQEPGSRQGPWWPRLTPGVTGHWHIAPNDQEWVCHNPACAPEGGGPFVFRPGSANANGLSLIHI